MISPTDINTRLASFSSHFVRSFTATHGCSRSLCLHSLLVLGSLEKSTLDSVQGLLLKEETTVAGCSILPWFLAHDNAVGVARRFNRAPDAKHWREGFMLRSSLQTLKSQEKILASAPTGP